MDTSISHSAVYGYFSEDPYIGLLANPNMPILHRSEQFSVDFELQILAESHEVADRNNDGLSDRAGYSMIVIAEDLTGVELAFFDDRIWAQGVGFYQAESALWNTQLFNHYRLIGDEFGYALQARNSLQENYVVVLSGSWRNYNPSGISDPFKDPYNNPSFLFFGDNTTSASATALLGDVIVRTGPLPEPRIKSIPIPPWSLMILVLSLGGFAVNRSAAKYCK